MEFKVNFRAVEVAGNTIRPEKEYDIRESSEIINSVNIGTELLQKLNILTDDIHNTSTKSYVNNIGINISQEDAEQLDCFKTKNEIYVKVSKELLQPLFDIVFKDNHIKYEPRIQDVIKLWKDNNYESLVLSDNDKVLLQARNDRRRKLEESKIKEQEEKKNWILENGSEYLKNCLELGQYAHKNYVLERVAKEFPGGFTLDYENNAKWDTKYSPSPDAINELKELRKKTADSEIIWLTREPVEAGKEYNYDDDEFEACEALIVKNFLGKYDLIKLV